MKGKKDFCGKKIFIRVLLVLLFVCFLGFAFLVISNLAMVKVQGKKIVTAEEAKNLNAECILILGAGVRGSNPSPMLADRLLEGLDLYKQGVAPKIIVSGDHGKEYYDEVNVMKNYLVERGVPDTDIFMDHAGFSTYESMARAKEVFGVERMVVVTQEYHLYRALFICDWKNIEALGVSAGTNQYYGQTVRDIREWLARDKDIFSCLFNIKPKYLGEKVDISGDGNVTND